MTPEPVYKKGDKVQVLLPGGWHFGRVHDDDAPRFSHESRKYEIHGDIPVPFVTIASAASMREWTE